MATGARSMMPKVGITDELHDRSLLDPVLAGIFGHPRLWADGMPLKSSIARALLRRSVRGLPIDPLAEWHGAVRDGETTALPTIDIIMLVHPTDEAIGPLALHSALSRPGTRSARCAGISVAPDSDLLDDETGGMHRKVQFRQRRLARPAGGERTSAAAERPVLILDADTILLKPRLRVDDPQQLLHCRPKVTAKFQQHASEFVGEGGLLLGFVTHHRVFEAAATRSMQTPVSTSTQSGLCRWILPDSNRSAESSPSECQASNATRPPSPCSGMRQMNFSSEPRCGRRQVARRPSPRPAGETSGPRERHIPSALMLSITEAVSTG
jgi:hypothetical protein